MDRDNILALAEKCIEKAANDFLAEKPVDSQAFNNVMEGVRILHHAVKIERFDDC